MKNYFQILGLEESATLNEIKTAYRTYAKNFHPDKHNGNEFFKERFQEIQEAYEYLCQKYNNDKVIIQDAQLLTFYIELQNEGDYVLPNDCITIKYSILHCTYIQLIVEDAEHMWQLDMPVCNYENIYYLNLSKYEIKGNIKLKIKYGNSLCNGESKKIIDVFIATNYNLLEANKYAHKFSYIGSGMNFIAFIIVILPFCLGLVVAIFSIWIDIPDFIPDFILNCYDKIKKLKWYHWIGYILFIVIIDELFAPLIEEKRRKSYNNSLRKKNRQPL